ncbi:hypothetical protein EIP91_001553 [Steccherinum ochraceum]|uniref:Uncharacterized protein n=1 Tax=Steccherinum ochraceum TaxID=92696 RepID=A0A4V2MWH7_9APHY|nr:hypothetical protein EIP91_001553 [Steccherinum ochraceum]
MRCATLFACAFTLAISSAIAVPLHSSQARRDHEDALVGRDFDLIARDILQAIHARELAALDARTIVRRGNAVASGIAKAKDKLHGGSAGTNAVPNSPAPSFHTDPDPPSFHTTASADYAAQDQRRAQNPPPAFGAQGLRDGGHVRTPQPAQPAHAASNAAAPPAAAPASGNPAAPAAGNRFHSNLNDAFPPDWDATP